VQRALKENDLYAQKQAAKKKLMVFFTFTFTFTFIFLFLFLFFPFPLNNQKKKTKTSMVQTGKRGHVLEAEGERRCCRYGNFGNSAKGLQKGGRYLEKEEITCSRNDLLLFCFHPFNVFLWKKTNKQKHKTKQNKIKCNPMSCFASEILLERFQFICRIISSRTNSFFISFWAITKKEKRKKRKNTKAEGNLNKDLFHTEK